MQLLQRSLVEVDNIMKRLHKENIEKWKIFLGLLYICNPLIKCSSKQNSRFIEESESLAYPYIGLFVTKIGNTIMQTLSLSFFSHKAKFDARI